MILYYEVHSFTDRIFAGNPAGVCPLEEWLDDDLWCRQAEDRVHISGRAALYIKGFLSTG